MAFMASMLYHFFPYVSPKFNKFLHLWYLAYMFCLSFYLLKKVLLVSFKVSIIYYLSTSLNEFLKFNPFVPKFVNPTLFILFYLHVVGSAPPINFLSSFGSSFSSSLWLLLSSFEFFDRSHCWFLLSVV